MQKKSILIASLALLLITAAISCKKPEPTPTPTPTAALTGQILTDEANNVIQPNYSSLASHSDSLYQSIVTLQSAQTADNLVTSRRLWISARKDYEQSEGFLFGPIVYDNIDPNIDTWPIDSVSIDSLIKGPAVFTQGFVDSLSEGLKGFHPIEYLLYGNDGSKTAAEISPRQFQFMTALALNVKTLTAQIAGLWNPQTSSNYYNQFITAGSGSTVYTTQKAAYQDLVNAMIGICDEVGNDKMEVPFSQKNAGLEESHYSNNSLNDFKYNIIGLQNVYLGHFTAGGNGVSNLVQQYNLSLDNTIKADINAAIGALNGITVPFGDAITQQPTQVQNAITAINTLNNELQTQLLPFVQKYTN